MDSKRSKIYPKIVHSQKDVLEESLEKLFSNIYYTWNPKLYNFIDKLDSYDWRKSLGPAANIQRYLEEKSPVEQDSDLTFILQNCNNLETYLKDVSWFDEQLQLDPKMNIFIERPIAYFSAEFAFVDWLQIYSGGLGVLAADFVKQASDSGLPLIGIGIFYHQGYFHQDIDSHGFQKEVYIPQHPTTGLLRLVKDMEDHPIEISVIIKDHEVFVRAWELEVGRCKVLLLDTNYEKNKNWEDRMITAHLYGGTTDTRIRQEIILGMGGYRLLRKLEITPSVIHMNEGHASFVVIEKIRDFLNQNTNFDEAFKLAKKNILFTNHTLNPAGNDKFDFKLLKEYFDPIAQDLGIDFNQIFHKGSNQLYSGANFSMTTLGLSGSEEANAVSKLHGEAAKRLWPDFKMHSVTNGVHLPTWVAPMISELYCKYVDEEWYSSLSNNAWEKINSIPNEMLWEVHQIQKKHLIDRINGSLGTNLKYDVLTLAWTRRFTAYKRPDIFLHDLDRLSKLINNSNLPVQFIIGGKAHPQDTKGKELLQSVVSICLKSEFKDKITFLTGYNWNLARYVTSGSDVWLNTPIRFEEACGTSGMKSGSNGVLQFTTMDGWTDEIDWKEKGWVIGNENSHEEIYTKLENEIAPAYYERPVPNKWVRMMKHTMIECCSHYNSERMLQDYLKIYKELLK